MEHIPVPAFAGDCIAQLEKNGFCAYLVGGCVRDALMGKEPHDYDLTTDATPQEMLQVFSGYRVIPTGLQHGTLTVLSHGQPIEITTFRVDGAYLDNRHPSSVSFAKHLEDDLSRRDFTVNAMAYSPRTGLVDLFGGREHLRAGIIACVGNPDQRFREDGLRLMRAIRFASVLSFAVDRATAESIHRNRLLLRQIAAERIYAEFTRLLAGPGAVPILSAYGDVIAVFAPELEQVPFGDDARRAMEFLGACGGPVPITVLFAAYFSGMEADAVGHILRRLRADNRTHDSVVSLLRDCRIPLPQSGSTEENLRELRRFLRGKEPDYAAALFLLRAALAADGENRSRACTLAEQAQAVYESGTCLSLVGLALKGQDLLSVGIPGGRRMGEILERLLCLVIDGDLRNERQVLLDAALRMAAEECAGAETHGGGKNGGGNVFP